MTLQPPPYNPQSSTKGDTDSCADQAPIHGIEMEQGNKQRWSPRAAAKLAGTKPGIGTNVFDVIDALNTYGLIPYQLWPDPDGDWTLDEYYADIPANVLKQANKSYSVSLTNDLSKLPLMVMVQVAPNFNHFIAQYIGFDYSSTTLIFDSYIPNIKPITTWQPQAIIKKWGLSLKLKTMLPGYKVSDPIKPGDETVYIMVGNSLVPVADWQAFLNLGGSTATVVSVTQAWLNGMQVVYGDLFKTNS